jgi:hypothetical protein
MVLPKVTGYQRVQYWYLGYSIDLGYQMEHRMADCSEYSMAQNLVLPKVLPKVMDFQRVKYWYLGYSIDSGYRMGQNSEINLDFRMAQLMEKHLKKAAKMVQNLVRRKAQSMGWH